MKLYLSIKKQKAKQSFLVLSFIFAFIVSSFTLAYAQAIAPDPTRLSVGGRILGMGKAFVGLTDDLGALYTNPAGLGGLENWQATSMSGNFMEDYSYLNVSGAYPTDLGVFGLGFTNSTIAGAYATKVKEGSDPNDPVYEIDPSQETINYYNNVLILSYGNKLENTRLPFKLPFETLFGTSLKLFYAGLSGDGIVNGSASGYELDLGIRLKLLPWLYVGSTVQNLLPYSMGGKLTYASGHTESYPAVWENGIALRVLGEKDALRQLGSQELKLLLDLDYYPTRNNFPMLMHYGLEWSPIPLLAIRTGIDQDAGGDGTGSSLTAISNLTAGVGLNVGGFRFDYAYHQFAGAPGITNNFFSLTYAVAPPPKIPARIQIIQPNDKSITFEDRLQVIGNVLDPNIRTLRLNSKDVRFSLKGEFNATANLAVGKNKLVVAGYNDRGKETVAKNIRLLRLAAFPDVPQGYWVREPISLLAMQKIITGYPNGTFKPEGNITRAEMCTLLMKALPETLTPKSPLPKGEGTFRDVAARHWAAQYIAQAAELGVVKGYPD
ncbi:MAG: S-layer homology domain-containing protein, partial [Candidatus Margulisbacteria bacterium]|nr:S-layer homology domain-containing protein [Candidatus Margulisiibacteriota bacterium]